MATYGSIRYTGIVDAGVSGGSSGPIDDTIIGGTTPAAGTFTDLRATELTLVVPQIRFTTANLSWTQSTDSYTSTGISTGADTHENIKRCVLNANGTVNYYLNPDDSTEKLDGTTANIDGTDGNVMVEIPKFYFRQVKNGTKTTWEISDVQLAGYQLHPAFYKNGEIVDYRYMGAYDACVYDNSASAYIAGLNLDDNTSKLDLANDKLASVSGIFPMVGVTRHECRRLAENVGTGWRQQDFWLTCAVQMLYLVEYGNFNSQSNLGNGNTGSSYVASSSSQTNSPNSVAGKSNSLGNDSTNSTSGASSATRGTAFMSYRGIENFFGNCFKWVDGFNIGIVVNRDVWVSNTDTDFADNTSTNYIQLNGTLATANGFVSNILDIDGAYLPSVISGSSSTFLTDQFFQVTGNRVAAFGGDASSGAGAGAFCWRVSFASSIADRGIGARLCF